MFVYIIIVLTDKNELNDNNDCICKTKDERESNNKNGINV